MDNTAFRYVSLFPETSSPLAKYVYTADDPAIQPEPEIPKVHIDPALLEEDELEQQLRIVLREEIARLDESENRTGTSLGRVAELRVEEGFSPYRETPTQREEPDDRAALASATQTKTLDDRADAEQSSSLRGGRMSNADNRNSVSKAATEAEYSTRVAIDEENASPAAWIPHGLKRSYSDTDLIERLNKHRKSA